MAFPGHFLVKCAVRDGAAVIDPFNRGRTLGVDELRKLLAQAGGGENPDRAQVAAALATAGTRSILVRMLRNLKAIYLRYEQFNQVLSVSDRILMVAPELADEVRDRGAVYLRLECFRAALGDFQRYLDIAPDAADVASVRERVVELQRQAARLN